MKVLRFWNVARASNPKPLSKRNSSRLARKPDSPALKLHIPSLSPELNPVPNLDPKAPPASDPPVLSSLFQPSYHLCGTYPCRCRGYGLHRCHSCTPGLYGGHRAVLRGNPGWAEQHTPCSSCIHLGLSWPLGDRMGALPDTHTPLDSQQSPTGGDRECTLVNLNTGKPTSYNFHVRRSHTGTKQDNSLTHVSQITEIPQSVWGLSICWIPSTVPSPTGISVTLCRLPLGIRQASGDERYVLWPKPLTPPDPHSHSYIFCFSLLLSPYTLTHHSHSNNSQQVLISQRAASLTVHSQITWRDSFLTLPLSEPRPGPGVPLSPVQLTLVGLRWVYYTMQ